MSEIDCCPYCKGTGGFYEKLIERRSYYYEWDGCPDGASENDVVRGGENRYCSDCHRDVTKKVVDNRHAMQEIRSGGLYATRKKIPTNYT